MIDYSFTIIISISVLYASKENEETLDNMAWIELWVRREACEVEDGNSKFLPFARGRAPQSV